MLIFFQHTGARIELAVCGNRDIRYDPFADVEIGRAQVVIL